MSAKISIRAATPADASDMAVLVDIAAYGLASCHWRGAVTRGEGVSVLEVGRMRALRKEGSFSYLNGVMADYGGRAAGLLVGYNQPDVPEDVDPNEIDPVLRPLYELEALAVSTWYVNVLATFHEFRGKGVGTALMGEAGRIAARAGRTDLSLIAEDDNVGGIRLYERLGFKEVARRTFVPFAGSRPAEHFILMIRRGG